MKPWSVTWKTKSGHGRSEEFTYETDARLAYAAVKEACKGSPGVAEVALWWRSIGPWERADDGGME